MFKAGADKVLVNSAVIDKIEFLRKPQKFWFIKYNSNYSSG